jgi:hypothetical protein
MNKYIIKDVWMALRISLKNMMIMLFIMWAAVFFIFSGTNMTVTDMTSHYIFNFALIMSPLVVAQSVIIYFANRPYIIDLDSGSITFPRSDIENSIAAILLLFPYWNLMRTKTIHASDIENIYLDTKRWSTKHKTSNGMTASGKAKHKTGTQNHVRYTVNIVGTFGSANLAFLGRQKRDEVRNAIQQSVKKYSGINVDRKVAEFS